jgi:hypothetical protein
MKHILRERMIINESERSRILGLHDNFRRTMGGFLHEQNMDEATKFFESQKTKFNKFPINGKVVPYENTFGYEVVNADKTKYILLPNGTAVIDNASGTGYKPLAGYTWTKSPYVAGSTPGSTPAGPGLSGFNADSDGNGIPDYLQTQNPQDKSTLPPPKTEPIIPPSRKEIRQGYRQRNKDAATLKKEKDNQLSLMDNEIKRLQDDNKKYNNMLTNTRLSGQMSAQQKTDIDNAVKNNNILIKNKEAEKTKLTAGETVTTPTATVAPQTPKSREDQAAIDAGI